MSQRLSDMVKKAIPLGVVKPDAGRLFKIVIRGKVLGVNQTELQLQVSGDCNDVEVVEALARVLAAVDEQIKKAKAAPTEKKIS